MNTVVIKKGLFIAPHKFNATVISEWHCFSL